MFFMFVRDTYYVNDLTLLKYKAGNITNVCNIDLQKFVN